MTAQEKRELRRNRRNARVARCRWLKNFLFWLAGFLFVPIILAATVFFIPIKTFFGGSENAPVSEELSNQTIVSAVTNYESFGFSDISFLTSALSGAISSSPVSEIVSVNEDKLNEIKFSDFGGENIADTLKQCFIIDATLTKIDSLIGGSLQNITNLSVFKNYQEVPDNEKPELNENLNINNYYYKVDEEHYAKAFTETFQYAEGVNEDTQLYYPALNDVQIFELTSVLMDGIMRNDMTELLTTFDSSFDTESMLGKIVKDKTVKDITALSADEFVISDLLDLTDSESSQYKMVNMLCNAVNSDPKPTVEQIKFGDLSNVDINIINLSVVLDNAPETTWGILEDASGKNRDEITIGDLQNINTDNIKLSTVVDVNSSNQLWSILEDATGENKEDLTLNALTQIDVNNIKLSSILADDASNDTLWTILTEAAQCTKEELTVGKLSNLNFNDVKISSVVGNIDGKLKLAIEQSTGISFENATLGVLDSNNANSFNISNVKLETFVEKSSSNSKMWDLIDEGVVGTGADNAILICDLDNFNVDNIKLSTIVERGSNTLINALIDKEATISTLGTTINDLSLYDIYGYNSFTLDSSLTNDTTEKYTRTENNGKYTFTSDVNGNYYLNKDAGIWLILCFNGNGASQQNGQSTIYTQNEMTFGSLQNDSSAISKAIQDSTVKDLIICKVIPNMNLSDTYMRMTFETFMTTVSTLLP